ALVTTNGFNRHDVSLVDLKEGKVAADDWVRQSWFGLAVNKAEDKIWWSGGGNGFLHTFDIRDGKFTRTSKKEQNSGKKKDDVANLPDEMRGNKAFKSGMCLNEARGELYTLDINAGTVTAVALNDEKVKERVGTLGGRPYD